MRRVPDSVMDARPPIWLVHVSVASAIKPSICSVRPRPICVRSSPSSSCMLPPLWSVTQSKAMHSMPTNATMTAGTTIIRILEQNRRFLMVIPAASFPHLVS